MQYALYRTVPTPSVPGKFAIFTFFCPAAGGLEGGGRSPSKKISPPLWNALKKKRANSDILRD